MYYRRRMTASMVNQEPDVQRGCILKDATVSPVEAVLKLKGGTVESKQVTVSF